MYRGVYLNRARNERRRLALTQRLAEVGAAPYYQRFEAVDGRAVAAQHPTKLDPGNLGLWLSHEHVVEAAAKAADAHLHIIEYDAVLARNFAPLLDGLLASADRQYP